MSVTEQLRQQEKREIRREERRTHVRLHGLESAGMRLSVSHYTLRKMIRLGHIKAVRIGARLLISDYELERVVREGAGNYVYRRKEAGSATTAEP